MNDAQLVAFFNKPMKSLSKDGSVCGRFIHDQLDRTIDISKKRIPWVKYFFQFTFPAFLISSKAAAQGQVRMLTGDTIIVPKQKIDKAEKIPPTEAVIRISGKVIDDNGDGVPDASVFIKGITNGVATDSTGNFVIKYRDNEKNLVLVGSSIGFLEMERIVDLNKEKEAINISLIPNNTLGEVVVVGITEVKGRFVTGGISVIKKENIFDTICNKFSPKCNR